VLPVVAFDIIEEFPLFLLLLALSVKILFKIHYIISSM